MLEPAGFVAHSFAFIRVHSTPITELPAHWPAAYRQLIERRIALIESDRNIATICGKPKPWPGYYERMRTNESWSDERLLPLLAGVLELLPASMAKRV